MEETKRIGFINKSNTGMWGTLTFDDVKYYIRNVRKAREELLAADVQEDTGETFLNKANKVCKRYKTVGALLLDSTHGRMSLCVNGKTVAENFEVSSHSGQKGDYLRLTFAEPNPYLQGLMATVNRGIPEAEATPATDPAPVQDEIPDTLPF